MVGLLRDDFWEEVDVWGLQGGFGAVFLGGESGRWKWGPTRKLSGTF